MPSTDVARDATSTVDVHVGCFNIDISQSSLCIEEHVQKLRRILRQGFAQGRLNILGLCGVGEPMQGLHRARLDPQDLVNGCLSESNHRALAVDRYMSAWHPAGASQPGGASLHLLDAPHFVTIDECIAEEQQLLVWKFAVTAYDRPDEMGRLVYGQLNINNSSRKTLAGTGKMCILAQAFAQLECQADAISIHHTVTVLSGDVDVRRDIADVHAPEAQSDFRSQWHRVSSANGLCGDVAFVRGLIPKLIEVCIGASYDDKGMDNVEHDFFGFAIQVPLSPVACSRTTGARARAPSHDICFERGGEEEEKRIARDRVAYTRAEFFAYYSEPQWAQQEWDNAPVSPEAIVIGMRSWYEDLLRAPELT